MSAPPSLTVDLARSGLRRPGGRFHDVIDEQNDLFHREIYRRMLPVLEVTRAMKSYSILDLGCGTVRHLAPALHATEPASYVGVDPSGEALLEAGKYLHGLPQVELRQDDICSALNSSRQRFDVIFSAFARHHLPAGARQNMLNACATRLEAGGLLVIVDVVRDPGQDRQNCLSMIEQAWSALPAAHQHELYDHVDRHEQPETVADLRDMGRTAGFRECRLVCQHRQNAMMVFHS